MLLSVSGRGYYERGVRYCLSLVEGIMSVVYTTVCLW